ncbi:hypothetical protein [Dictyobacter kobayashii]|uniref:Uncharacterized protein n=1 Tax=Dictyobacter kobayashii TaxID=2014872 RepID=A0A402ABA9_9CHLR|nr:hypothetical protein [Dictyobacter kobayashii]GCE16281.1 hypothetical protein KDK_00810 [Dictyobacter kobayashii]
MDLDSDIEKARSRVQISADNYEISFNPQNPEQVRIFDTETLNELNLTIDEAFSLLQVMLKNRSELYTQKHG